MALSHATRGTRNPGAGLPRHFAHFQPPLAQLAARLHHLKALWVFETTAFWLQMPQEANAVSLLLVGPGSCSWR